MASKKAYPRPAGVNDVADTIRRLGGPAWALRSTLSAEVREQFEISFGYSNAFFAAFVDGEWRVVGSRIAALDKATPELFFAHRKDIAPTPARDYLLRFADPVPVAENHPAAMRLRAMLAQTSYRGKKENKIYVLKSFDAPENKKLDDQQEEENAFIAYLALRASRLSPDGRRTLKDIAISL
jgi:hypothetical protein